MTTIIPPHAVSLVLQVLPSLFGFLTVSHVVRPFVAGHDDHLLKAEEDVVHIDEWLYKPDPDDEFDRDDDDDWLAFERTTFLKYCYSFGSTSRPGVDVRAAPRVSGVSAIVSVLVARITISVCLSRVNVTFCPNMRQI
jgi:hypothetical protein